MIPLKRLLKKEPSYPVGAAPISDAKYKVTAVEHEYNGIKYAEFDYFTNSEPAIFKLRVFINLEGEIKKWLVADSTERTADIDLLLVGRYHRLEKIDYTDDALRISEIYLSSVSGIDITGMLDSLSALRRYKKLSAKYYKEEKLKEEYFSQIPEFEITDRHIDIIRKQVIYERFLFKWNERYREPLTDLSLTQTMGFCTVCGKRTCFPRYQYRHNDGYDCENCGAHLTVKEMGRSHKRLLRHGAFQAVRKLSGNCFMLSSFVCRVDCSDMTKEDLYVPQIYVNEQTRHIFDVDRGIYRRYEKCEKNVWKPVGNFDGCNAYDYGFVSHSYFGGDVYIERRYNGMWIFFEDSIQALKETNLRYLDWQNYLPEFWDTSGKDVMNIQGGCLWNVFYKFLRYPVYEMFLKCGAYKLFKSSTQLLESQGIDVNGKTCKEVFGIPAKHVVAWLRANPEPYHFDYFVEFVEAWPDVSSEMIMCLSPFWSRADERYKRIKHLSLLPEKAKKYKYDMEIYRDYISDCVRLGWDLSDKYVEFPKDVLKAHADAQVQIDIKDNKKYELQIKNRAKECAEYFAEKDGLIIRPAQSVEDLILEGAMQNNCVARNYTESYANGNCIIMFVRRKEDPDKSYITVEIRNGVVVQSRIKGNLLPYDEGEAFLKWYEEAVLRKVNNKKKKARKVV